MKSSYAKDLHIIPGTDRHRRREDRGIKFDLVLIHNGDKGYEISYKGTAAQDKIDLQNYLRRRQHSIEWIFRKWMNDPTVALFYDGLDDRRQQASRGRDAAQQPDDSVSVCTRPNHALSHQDQLLVA